MKFCRTFFIFFSIIFFASCYTSTYKKDNTPKPVEYINLQKSTFFDKNNAAFSIDSINNTLFLQLGMNGMKNLPFPINTQYHDTLTKTVFNFDFYTDGQLILSDFRSLKNSLMWRTDTSSMRNFLSISSDTIDLEQGENIKIEIPFYAFHKLKKGKHTIELNMWQNLFTGDVRVTDKEGYGSTIHLLATKPFLSARVKFNIEVPEIYQSNIYGQGLELRNDSTFSPAGMDNTLWNSSYPDIYWTIFYPLLKYPSVEGSTERYIYSTQNIYAQTPVEGSTDRYVGHDTFKLYHYFKNDWICLGVWDHDMLSRDDGLGTWFGNLEDLTKRNCTRLSFDCVKNFDVIVKDVGVVN